MLHSYHSPHSGIWLCNTCFITENKFIFNMSNNFSASYLLSQYDVLSTIFNEVMNYELLGWGARAGGGGGGSRTINLPMSTEGSSMPIGVGP